MAKQSHMTGWLPSWRYTFFSWDFVLNAMSGFLSIGL
jgi:hypothetical protein